MVLLLMDATGGAPSSSKNCKFAVTFTRDNYLRCKSLAAQEAYIIRAVKTRLFFSRVADQCKERRAVVHHRSADRRRTVTEVSPDRHATPTAQDGERDNATNDNKPEQHNSVDAQQERDLQAMVEERIRRLLEPSDEAHKYRLRAIKNYKAPATHPPTTSIVTFDPSLPAIQQ